MKGEHQWKKISEKKPSGVTFLMASRLVQTFEYRLSPDISS